MNNCNTLVLLNIFSQKRFQVYAYYKHLAGYISLDKGFRQQCQTLGTNIAR